VSPDNPLGLDITDPAAPGRRLDAEPAESTGRPAGDRSPVEQGRGSQPADAREGGRDSRHRAAPLVHADEDGRMGDPGLWPQKKGGAPGAGAPLWRID